MSDLNNGMPTNSNGGVSPADAMDQATRVVPAMGDASFRNFPAQNATPVRHRRAARHAAEMTEEDAPEEAKVAEPANAAGVRIAPRTPASPVRESEPSRPAAAPRMNARAAGQPASGGTPAQGVPRPAALRGQNGVQPPRVPTQVPQGARRPVKAPGFTQQTPPSPSRNDMFLRQDTTSRPTPRTPVQPVMRSDDRMRPRRAPEEDDRDEDYQDGNEPPRRRGHGLLITLLVLVLILGMLVLGFLLIPNDDSTLGTIKGNVQQTLTGLFGGKTVTPAEITEFSAAPTSGTAPMDILFTLTTNKQAAEVRVVNESGETLVSSAAAYTDNSDSLIWMLNLTLDSAFDGTVQAEVRSADSEEWASSGKTQSIRLTEPVALEPTTTPAPSPTAAVIAQPGAEDNAVNALALDEGDVPMETEVPTIAPTATLEVTVTPTIAPTATPSPSPTPTAVPTATPTATPVPTATPAPKVSAVMASNLSDVITKETIYSNSKKLTDYTQTLAFDMGTQDTYNTLDFGVTTFRGSSFRQNAASGNVSGTPNAMSLLWTTEAGSAAGSSRTYYGIGWTGQPAIIKLSKEVREATDIVEAKRSTSGLKEVYVAGLDGKIYFLDLADGQATRNAIDVGFPMYGSVTYSPDGVPLLVVGQYARKMKSGTGDIGLRFFNILNQKQLYLLDGLDGKYNRPLNETGAFNTSVLIDRSSKGASGTTTDNMIAIGSNGMLYNTELNVTFDYKQGALTIDPTSTTLVTKAAKQTSKTVSVDSSPAMYQNYVYYADLMGVLHCVDTTTMTTQWAVKTGDAVKAAVSLDFDDNGKLWVYTANTLSNRAKGACQIRRYDAMTGEEGWTAEIAVKNTKSNDATPGAMASAVIGQQTIGDLVIYALSNVSTETGYVDDTQAGLVVALNKSTGAVEWTYATTAYLYASPVAVYTEAGDARIIQCAADGTIYMLDNKGSLVNTLQVTGTIEASPAVYQNTMVIGTTGKGTSFIYGIALQ